MVIAVIPFRPENPKTRLSCVLDQAEREKFALMMLRDVVEKTVLAGCSTILLSTEDYHVDGASTVVKKLGLNEALNEFLSETNEPVLIIMSDIPLATLENIESIISVESDCAIVPGRGGGTNTIFIKEPSRFRVDFYGASFLDHMNIAKEAGLSVEVIDTFRMSTDIDEKEDLVEILLHGNGESRRYLESLGFAISVNKGRVGVHRDSHEEAL
jgi:2-phospho-L-lactate guanylyltransferase